MSRFAEQSPAPRRRGTAIRVRVIAEGAVRPAPIGRSLGRCDGARFEVSRLRALAPVAGAARRRPPDAIVLELSGTAGLERVRDIALAYPDVPLIVVAPRGAPALAARAIRHGAQDCLSAREADGERLARAIRMAIERKRAEAQLLRRAHFDSLTGLANRALFADRLAHALARARRRGERVGLLYLDLDGFKAINDARGHAAGDAALRQVAARLRAAVRESETAARFGGDEFTVLIEPLRDPADAGAVAARIGAALRRPLEVERHEVRLSASIGIAIFPDDGADPQALLRSADRAMFRVKRSGGGHAGFASERRAGGKARRRGSRAPAAQDAAGAAAAPLLDFGQAAERARRGQGAAFAFCPIAGAPAPRRDAACAGANLFVVADGAGGARRSRADAGYRVIYVGGRFGTDSLVRMTFAPSAVPREAREARYRPLAQFDESLLRGDLHRIHAALALRALPPAPAAAAGAASNPNGAARARRAAG
jgi:diguanylate cyclase (GGDEF)-like protein